MINQYIFSNMEEEIDFYVRIALTIFLIIYVYLMYQTARSKDSVESQKEIALGFGNFVIALLVAQFLFLIAKIYSELKGESLFPRYIRIGGTGYEYLMLLCFAIAFSILMKPIEKYLLNQKQLWITRLNQISFILMLIPYLIAFILNQRDSDFWTFVAYPGIAIFAVAALFSIFGSFLFYIRLGLKSTGSLRNKGFLIGFGMIFLYFGLILLEIQTALLGSIVMAFGSLMVVIGQKKKV